MKKSILLIVSLCFLIKGYSQSVNKEDSSVIKNIYNTALQDGASYDWLDYLSNNITR